MLKFSTKIINKKQIFRSFSTDLKRENRLRRVLFNVPGSDTRKITKASGLNLDCVVLDLEDGVAINQKDTARQVIVQTLSNPDIKFGRAERLVRMNSISSGFEEKDLEDCLKHVVSNGHLDAIVVPKVESAEHLEIISNFLDRHEKGKKVNLLAAIESARAIVDLKEICKAKTNNRLAALIFASEDFCANMGMTRTPEAKELLFARSTVVTHAVAFGLQSIDMVCLDYKNEEVISKETVEGRIMGYTGKQAIHPFQIEPIYAAFKPSAKELDFAQRILDGNDKHQAEGKGAFSLDGKMIDMPMVKWALNIVERSKH